jgi:NarL family two-component system response regulator LiaR
MPIRILIADDHHVVRQGLRMFLSLDPELGVVGEAGDGAEALRLAKQLRPDVVLMDLLMPVMDGTTAIREIKCEAPEVEVIALTSVLEEAAVTAAIRAGAMGYLLKDTQADELCRAIKAVASGQVQLPPQAVARLLRALQDSPLPQPKEALSERETQVLCMLTQGKANKEIAAHLHLGETTVKSHVSNILSKLGLASRTQAALYAVQNRLVAEDCLGRPGEMAQPAFFWKAK